MGLPQDWGGCGPLPPRPGSGRHPCSPCAQTSPKVRTRVICLTAPPDGGAETGDPAHLQLMGPGSQACTAHPEAEAGPRPALGPQITDRSACHARCATSMSPLPLLSSSLSWSLTSPALPACPCPCPSLESTSYRACCLQPARPGALSPCPALPTLPSPSPHSHPNPGNARRRGSVTRYFPKHTGSDRLHPGPHPGRGLPTGPRGFKYIFY